MMVQDKVLVAITEICANSKEGVTVQNITEMTGMNSLQVRNAISRLTQKDLIDWHADENSSNLYHYMPTVKGIEKVKEIITEETAEEIKETKEPKETASTNDDYTEMDRMEKFVEQVVAALTRLSKELDGNFNRINNLFSIRLKNDREAYREGVRDGISMMHAITDEKRFKDSVRDPMCDD